MEPSHFNMSNPAREQPMAIANALGQGGVPTWGRIANVYFTQNGTDDVMIPVVGGLQTFDGQGYPASSGGRVGSPNDPPQAWNVQLAPVSVPFSGSTFVGVYWQLRYWVQGAQYQTAIRPLDITSQTAGPLSQPNGQSAANCQVIVASSLEVTLWGVQNNTGNLLAPLQVSVAMSPFAGGSLGAERFAWQWIQSGIGKIAAIEATDILGNKFLQGATIGAWRSYLVSRSVGTTNLYPMLFDLASHSSLVSGTTLPIAGGRLNAIVNPGDSQNMGDEFRPGSLRVGTGLVVALSSTPDVYTAATGSISQGFDIKVGT